MPKDVPQVTGIRKVCRRKREPIPKPSPVPGASCQGSAPPPRPSPELSPRCRISKSPSSFRRKTDAPFPKTATRESAARTSLEMHVEKP